MDCRAKLAGKEKLIRKEESIQKNGRYLLKGHRSEWRATDQIQDNWNTKINMDIKNYKQLKKTFESAHW